MYSRAHLEADLEAHDTPQARYALIRARQRSPKRKRRPSRRNPKTKKPRAGVARGKITLHSALWAQREFAIPQMRCEAVNATAAERGGRSPINRRAIHFGDNLEALVTEIASAACAATVRSRFRRLLKNARFIDLSPEFGHYRGVRAQELIYLQ